MQAIDLKDQQNIYTVSKLNNEAKFLLEGAFPFVWVEGEISNFAAPNSGHWYFSLKDTSSSVRCAMFRGQHRDLGFLPKDGMHVLIKGRVSLYPNRGEFQLIAEFIEERGEGKLRLAYEALKKKLETQGLFDNKNKQTLPLFPTQIGVITSATGAAIRDILTILKRRHPSIPIIIYPSLVQGKDAAATIVKAIEIANVRNECDVIILARGGGSLEDLWPFNEEIVAQAIFASKIPIISAVGHEVDFTIADFVADVRAPTPSAAAEISTPDSFTLMQQIVRFKQLIIRHVKNKIRGNKQQLTWTEKHLKQQHPKRRLAEKMQLLDYHHMTLIQLQKRLFHFLQNKIKVVESTLQRKTPSHAIKQIQAKMDFYNRHLLSQMVTQLNKNQVMVANAATKLNALSPLATLKRGYSIATHEEHPIRNANAVKPGDLVRVQLMKGSLDCHVLKVKEQKN